MTRPARSAYSAYGAIHRDGAVPPQLALGALELPDDEVMRLRAVLDHDVRIGHQVGVPARMLGWPPLLATRAYSPACSTRMSAILRTLPLWPPSSSR